MNGKVETMAMKGKEEPTLVVEHYYVYVKRVATSFEVAVSASADNADDGLPPHVGDLAIKRTIDAAVDRVMLVCGTQSARDEADRGEAAGRWGEWPIVRMLAVEAARKLMGLDGIVVHSVKATSQLVGCGGIAFEVLP